MVAYLYVAVGSALGGVARYWIALVAAEVVGDTFPWGTLAINVLGSFVIGLFAALTVTGGIMPAGLNARLFVMTGLCGGFTTFSAFSLQSVQLLRDGQYISAVSYMVGSVVACIIVTGLGFWIASRFSPTSVPTLRIV